ncbi:hypothetical protein JCM11491_005218 [Sporobolomyces phaffii]
MPAKRAQHLVHSPPSRSLDPRSSKRRRTTSLSTRYYRPRTEPDEPYVNESATSSEGSDSSADDESDANNKPTPRSARESQSTSNRSTLPRRSFTSRTYISDSPHPRRALLRSRNLLGIPSTRPDSASSAALAQPRPPRLRPRPRASRPLSPLPVNHSLARYRSAHRTKGMPLASNKRSRDPSVVPTGIRITRRTSGVLGPPNSGTATPDPKRKRSSGKLVESDSDEGARDDDDNDDGGGTDDLRMDAIPKRGNGRRVRDEVSEKSTETRGRGEEEADFLGSDACSKQREWPVTKLRSLRRSELVELFLSLPSSSTSQPDTDTMTKEALITAIVAARRPHSSSHRDSFSSNEDDNADASPQPRTSHEPSPEDGVRSPHHRGNRANATKTRRSGPRKLPLTPPHTSGEEDEHRSEAVMAALDAEERGGPLDHDPPHRSERRRGSQSEMPPPPLPAATATSRQPHRRTRSTANDPESIAPNALRFGKRLNHIIQEEAEEGTAMFTSPVAHRTRGHRPPSNPDASAAPHTIVANAYGSPARPGRAAKQRAVARIKGKGRAEDEDEDEEDDEMEFEDGSDEDEEDAAVLVLSSDSEGVRREASGRRNNDQGRRRRSSRTAVKQVETPPSDADEESGGDEGQEVEVEARSNLRAAGKGGKVVKLRTSHSKLKRHAEEDTEPELGEEDDEDQDMEADYEEEEEQDEDEVDLINATSKSLLRCRKDDLVRLCEERDLQNDGRTKQQLVEALLQWRDGDNDASSQDSDASTDSTLSNASTATARGATKTARLAKASHPSRKTSKNTPLLMRDEHSASPEKPRTVVCSKEREHQEDVNALDLESLQLQDKEIPPEKLTKLELVGSGGFKDVYKGTYRRRTIAICDIRGHLTDMDIKELGLLRDLRHENIVQFIGVSIPKQPSAVPVMIVTELCANGDLFDYIRGVEAPPFKEILDIMLGIAKGIEYLHTRTPSIIHRDIKSSNVLITSQGVAKIADFGLARIKTSTKSMIRSLVGTVNWQAPELWHPHPRYNEKVDVYSVGLVMWEMLQWHQAVKRYPFEGMNEHAIYADVGQRQLRPSLAGLHRRWGGEIVELMSHMWDQEYTNRPTMPQVVRRLKQLLALEKNKSK